MNNEQHSIAGAHLVGSVSTESARETLTVASEQLGGHLRRIPDGEVGKRFHWVLFQGEVFASTPGLSRMGEDPVIVAGFDLRPFTLDGTVEPDAIEFPALGYAKAALESYASFVELRGQGVIRPGTRFQVSLPTPLAPLTTFVHPDARPDLESAYTSALIAEINEMTAQIPREDLAIQFDLAIEFSYIETEAGRPVAIPSHAWFEPLREGLVERAAGMIDAVPNGVEVGIHLCYGDVGEKHFVEPLDTAHITLVANGIAEAVGRPLNWVHLPVPIDRDDREYFLPLADLSRDYEELYLGLIHHQDGREGAQARIRAATGAGITEFGIATECGFGRGPSERTLPLLQLHASVLHPCPPTDRLRIMPKMTPEEVERIAELALIDLTEEEKERFAKELDVIIDAAGTVADAVSDDIPATSHPLPLSNVWREDVPGETLPRDVVLDAAPEAEDGRFAVPQILGEDA